jgi:2-polyprenyl-3-methyl-5-hydroxy-6-metoxy-1,4-benzoquinol methylase
VNNPLSYREQQYDACDQIALSRGLSKLGSMRNYDWENDPRRFAFTFSRYKFVSKMFDGFESVLELGCGDGFASRIVRQTVRNLVITDFDPKFIDEINAVEVPEWTLVAKVHDMVKSPMEEQFDGIFSLDVLEHIQKIHEDTFLKNICYSLNDHGSLIIGMPSLESQVYASEGSKAGHVNCKSGNELRDFLKKYFHSVFMFSMNDEVLHTGFFPMSHYLLAVCCDKKFSGGVN